MGYIPFHSVRMSQQLFFHSLIRGCETKPTYFENLKLCIIKIEIFRAKKILAYGGVQIAVLKPRILQSKCSSTELACLGSLIIYFHLL